TADCRLPTADASLSSPITATTDPTSTVSPSCARISSKMPAPGLGTSASTLSVEISSNSSSFSTRSPTCFNHLETVPSVIDSPICGITTSTLINSPSPTKISNNRIQKFGPYENSAAAGCAGFQLASLCFY